MNEKQEREITSVYSVCRWLKTKLLFVFHIFLTDKIWTSVGKKMLGLVRFVENWHICRSGSLAVTFCLSKVERLN